MTMKESLSSGLRKTIIIVVVIYGYLVKGNGKALEFHINSFCYLEISTSIISVLPSKKRNTWKFQN